MESLTPSHYVSSHAACSSSSLGVLLTVWCSSGISHAFCLIVSSIQLLQAPGALNDSEISLLNIFPFLFRSHCLLTAMKVMRVISPDASPTMPLGPPASAILISLSIGGSPIGPLIRLRPSWVAIVASSLVVASIAYALCSCRAQPPPVVQRCWKCRSGVNSMAGIECQCPLVAHYCGC